MRSVPLQYGWLLVLLNLVASAGAIPGADNPDAYTRWTVQRDKLAFNRRTVLEAYKEAGHRDPKWDAKAIELLEGTCMQMAQSSLPTAYHNPSPTKADMVKVAQAVVDAGCDDPMVLDMCAIAFDDTGKDDTARTLAQRAATLFEQNDTKYTAFRQLNNARRALRLTPAADAQTRARLESRIYGLCVLSVTRNEAKGVERRFVYDLLEPVVEKTTPPEQARKFVEAIQANKNSDPWLTKTLAGRFYIRAGWDDRGGGFADTVTEEGWRGFAENLAKARTLLNESFILEPKFPEAATLMITVAMGGGGEGNENERVWFDRAVAAQLDQIHAYDAYLSSLLPRWSGSYPEMIKFGIECAATKRFDTDVPYMLIKTLNRMRDDGAGWDAWRTPGMFERAREVLLGYANWKAPNGQNTASWNQSAIAGYAWQIGNYAAARDALKANGDRIDEAGFASADIVTPQRAVSGIHALSGEDAKAMLAAEQLASAARHADAAAAYEKIAPKFGKDDPAARWVKGRAVELNKLAAFHRGEIVDLMPTDPELPGFDQVAGNWTLEEQDGQRSLVGVADSRGLRLLFGARFGPRYELLATVDLIEQGKNPDPGLGIAFGAVEANKYQALWLYPKGRQGVRMRFEGNSSLAEWPGRTFVEDGANLLKFIIWDDHGELHINGKGPCPFKNVRKWAQQPDALIGLSSTVWAGGKVRFKDVTIRRLDQQPEGGG